LRSSLLPYRASSRDPSPSVSFTTYVSVSYAQSRCQELTIVMCLRRRPVAELSEAQSGFGAPGLRGRRNMARQRHMLSGSSGVNFMGAGSTDPFFLCSFLERG
jgi:hypothetical protein